MHRLHGKVLKVGSTTAALVVLQPQALADFHPAEPCLNDTLGKIFDMEEKQGFSETSNPEYDEAIKELNDLLTSCPELVNRQNFVGATPLHQLACTDLLEAVKVIAKFNPDLTIKNVVNQTAAERAACFLPKGARIAAFLNQLAQKQQQSTVSVNAEVGEEDVSTDEQKVSLTRRR